MSSPVSVDEDEDECVVSKRLDDASRVDRCKRRVSGAMPPLLLLAELPTLTLASRTRTIRHRSGKAERHVVDIICSSLLLSALYSTCMYVYTTSVPNSTLAFYLLKPALDALESRVPVLTALNLLERVNVLALQHRVEVRERCLVN